MCRRILEIALYRSFQNGNPFGGPLLQIQGLTFECERLDVFRILLQDFFIQFRGLIELLILNQKLNVTLFHEEIVRMFSRQVGKLGRRFFSVAGGQIEITQNPVTCGIRGHSHLGLPYNLLRFILFSLQKIDRSKRRAGDDVPEVGFNRCAIFCFGFCPSLAPLIKTAKPQASGYEFGVDRDGFLQGPLGRRELLSFFLNKAESQVGPGLVRRHSNGLLRLFARGLYVAQFGITVG